MNPGDGDAVVRVERRRHDRSDFLSTSLLLDLTTITVDPAYVEASARRVARGEQSAQLRNGYGAAALLTVIGLLAAVAFSHTRSAAPQAARVRAGLVARVERLTKQTDAGDRVLERLRAQLAGDRDLALTASAADRELAESVRSLELAAGAAPVTGDGITVRIADAPAGSAAAARVQDRDLQRAVNIAWSAGAEAVAVNGQRIGPLTAIRQAGESILVDYRPVASPYDVRAIGDPATLEAAFTLSSSSAALRAIAGSLDFGFEVKRSGNLSLAGTGTTRTEIARPLGTPEIQERSPAP
jgi:uncharacterized protein YlxW (UPF0749 family)